MYSTCMTSIILGEAQFIAEGVIQVKSLEL